MKPKTNYIESYGLRDRVQAIPELGSILESIDVRISSGGENAFWDCEQDFRKLLDTDILAQLMNYELQRIHKDPSYVPSAVGSDVDFNIVISAGFSLNIRVIEPTMFLSSRLYSSTQNSMLGLAAIPNSGHLKLQLYEQPAPFPSDIMDRTKRLQDNGVQVVEPGDVLRIRAAADIFTIAEINAPIVLLFLASAPLISMSWEYDPSTLYPIRAVSGDAMASRIQFTAQMLAEIGDESSVPVLKTLMEHNLHFVRWSAVRSVMRLDTTEGIALLHQAVHDPHPHVRNAAIKALKQVEAVES